jgi:hypothetical protein
MLFNHEVIIMYIFKYLNLREIADVFNVKILIHHVYMYMYNVAVNLTKRYV